MDRRLILLPACALVLLTALVWTRLYITRIREIRRLRLHPDELKNAARTRELLVNVAGPSDNFSNLFELPVLFYTLTVLLYVTPLADRLQLTLATVFVATRYAHSFIHITYNRVMHRFTTYAIGSVVLWLMWLLFIAGLLGSFYAAT